MPLGNVSGEVYNCWFFARHNQGYFASCLGSFALLQRRAITKSS